MSDPATGIGGPFDTQFWSDYPYLLPCLFSSAMSAIALMLAAFMLPESLPKESRSESSKSPISQLGATFTSILASVDEMWITGAVPGFFFGSAVFDVRIDNVALETAGELGEPYCTANPNSSGVAGATGADV